MGQGASLLGETFSCVSFWPCENFICVTGEGRVCLPSAGIQVVIISEYWHRSPVAGGILQQVQVINDANPSRTAGRVRSGRAVLVYRCKNEHADAACDDDPRAISAAHSSIFKLRSNMWCQPTAPQLIYLILMDMTLSSKTMVRTALNRSNNV